MLGSIRGEIRDLYYTFALKKHARLVPFVIGQLSTGQPLPDVLHHCLVRTGCLCTPVANKEFQLYYNLQFQYHTNQGITPPKLSYSIETDQYGKLVK